MADVSQTPGNVVLVSGSTRVRTAGATITAGMPVYSDATDGGAIKPADADAAASAAVVGIALNGAADGQPVTYALPGSVINWGAVLTKNLYYVASTTAGAVAPSADLASGDYISLLCVGEGTATAEFIGKVTGVAV